MKPTYNKAEEEWGDWLKLMNYFAHELAEDEITNATYEAMSQCLMTFRPNVIIKPEAPK